VTISDVVSDKDEVDVLLGCDAVWTHRQVSTFRRNILSPSSGLKWWCWKVNSLYRVRGVRGELANQSQGMRRSYNFHQFNTLS
jgi:hypothetical protein